MDWTAGYIADIDYVHGYYSELNPARMRLAMLHAGLAAPDVGAACELGFGQGMSINVHAAASGVRWYGTDFLPSHAGFAQELAKASGNGARLFDDSFAEFAARTDLPDFDYIALHGIWSWVSPENRAVIVDFLRRKLKVGGVAYISYNVMAGWAPFVPMRQLLSQYVETQVAEGVGTLKRTEAAMRFADRLLAANPRYMAANPYLDQRMRDVRERDASYVAHEYFNRDWDPVQFKAVADTLRDAKLTFACSATLLQHLDILHLTAEQRAVLADIADPVFRESVRDMMVNESFRRDLWVKGARKLLPSEKAAAIRALRVVLTRPRVGTATKVQGILGEADQDAALYDPVLDILADNRPHTLGEIERRLDGRVKPDALLQVALVLTGRGDMSIANDDERIAAVRPQTALLNRHLCEKSKTAREFGHLASPVTGEAMRVERAAQMFLLARAEGVTEPGAMGRYVYELMQAEGMVLKAGAEAGETPEQQIARLAEMAGQFVERVLPVLEALQMV